MFRFSSTFLSRLFYSVEYFLRNFSMKKAKNKEEKGIKTINKWFFHIEKKNSFLSTTKGSNNIRQMYFLFFKFNIFNRDLFFFLRFLSPHIMFNNFKQNKIEKSFCYLDFVNLQYYTIIS